MNEWNKLIGTPKLARVIADINSDGHLQMRNWRYLISFYSNNKDDILRHKSLIEGLFNIKGRIYTKKVKNMQYRLFFISKELAKFLNKVGVVEGCKADKIFLVPLWIKNSDEKTKSAFLRGLYDCEGSIFPTKQRNGKVRWRITISQYKNKNIQEYCKYYMGEIKSMVNLFDIKTSPIRSNGKKIRKDGSMTIGYQFDIERPSFGNFYKHISFDNKIKQNKLITALESIEFVKRNF